ncbi:MAG TPA: cytochrome d ubiquinol oxidase subunit II [Conexibacter sp.]|nr:cytochrome d ubiquinol oxidase subunit II [Conexibacter sp.]
MSDLSVLQSIWFVAIVALWVLYLVLEGFDFGVGMLMRRVRQDHGDRRVALHAIGPTWAANEVWVVVAVVAMFGAFPEWYAAWSSALYLPLFVVLLALISRNAAIELLGKRDSERWRAGWERVLLVASTVAPFCWGLMWSAVVRGIALRGSDVVAGPLDVVSWYSVCGGVALVLLCRAQGAAFLSLRTDGDVRVAAARSLRAAAPVAFVAVGGFAVWTAAAFDAPGIVGWGACVACVAALGVAAGAGWRVGAGARAADAGAVGGIGARAAAVAFAAGCAAIGLLVVTWFAVLSPAGIAGGDGGAPLTLAAAAAGDYTLTLMTIVAGLLLPVLIGLQAWSYWLFRHRMTRADVGAPVPSPIDVVARVVGSADSAAPVAPSGPGFRRRRRP